MDIKYVEPFIEAFSSIMSQIGFSDIKRQGLSLNKDIKSTGITISVGIVGDVKGNVVYLLDEENGRKIASKMMMGYPVDEFNDMAQSAISELSNMITANAGTNFSNIGININISTPTLIFGEQLKIKMSTDKILSIKMSADDTLIDINLAFESL